MCFVWFFVGSLDKDDKLIIYCENKIKANPLTKKMHKALKNRIIFGLT